MALAEIVARKRIDVAARKAARPLDTFEGALAPSDRDFRGALVRGRFGLVLECKKASPSQGLLRPDFDAAALAADYADVADAISVLTDTPWFGGRHEDLRAVRAAVPQPVLCKDFVVDPWQVYEARSYGADAILLMVSVLPPRLLAECLAATRALGMDALVEAHDGDELAVALEAGARLVGINNRDLRTLRTDLAVTERLAAGVPPDVVLVGESGVHGHRDLLRLRPHVDALLVGTSLVRAPDAALAARGLAYGRVKVCGLTRPEDARAAYEAGATYGGLVFVPSSPRAVDLAAALRVQAGAPRLAWVGVFVDASPADVVATARALGLAAVQLHGDEPPTLLDALRHELPSECALWKAVRVRDRLPLRRETGADRLLLDAFREGPRGGTGATFDWRLLEGYPERAEVLLAGGLSPGNAAAADALGVWGLDVSSGVEVAPGHKDASRLAGLFGALRGRGRTRRSS